MYDLHNTPSSCQRCIITSKYWLLFAISFHQSSILTQPESRCCYHGNLLQRRATWKPFRFLFALQPIFDFVLITRHNQFNRSIATTDVREQNKNRWKWHSINFTNVSHHFVSHFEFIEFVICHFI